MTSLPCIYAVYSICVFLKISLKSEQEANPSVYNISVPVICSEVTLYSGKRA
jgi:hypothetical protein